MNFTIFNRLLSPSGYPEMKSSLHPVLFLLCLTHLFGYGQETTQCDAPVKGIKKISSAAENSDFFVPDKVIHYFNQDGLATKTETYHDALLT